MNFDKVCRTCLSSKPLKPIFRGNKYYDRFSLALLNTTGLKVEPNDGLPQNICMDCVAHINGSLKFRVQCKDSEQKLHQILNNSYVVNPFDVHINTGNTKSKIDGTLNEINFFHEINEQTDNVIAYPENERKVEIEIDEFCELEKDKLLKVLLQHKNNTDTSNMKVTESLPKTDALHHNIDVIAENDLDLNCNESKTNINSSESDSETVQEPTLNAKKPLKTIICTVCKKELSINSIHGHMSKQHPGANEKKLKCELCYKYILRNRMQSHTDTIHGKMCSKCAICKLELPTKDDLLRHVGLCKDKHTKRKPNLGKTGREMGECVVCHKRMQKASLAVHFRVKHEGLAPTCDYCGRKFRNKARLREHLRAKHGYGKFKCSYQQCEFETAIRLSMENHERRHRGERPYVCERCGAAFHARYLLSQHLQSHRTEKSIRCEICPASFKTNNSLHMHKMSCHSRATYNCPICQRSYKCRHYAVKHLRSVHKFTGSIPPLTQCASDDKLNQTRPD